MSHYKVLHFDAATISGINIVDIAAVGKADFLRIAKQVVLYLSDALVGVETKCIHLLLLTASRFHQQTSLLLLLLLKCQHQAF